MTGLFQPICSRGREREQKTEITPWITVILIVFVNECYGGNRTNNKKFLISALLWQIKAKAVGGLWQCWNLETSYMETFGQRTNQFVENLLYINRLEILKSNVCSAFSGQFRIKPWSPSPSTQLGFYTFCYYNICKSSNYAKYNTKQKLQFTKAVTTTFPNCQQ